MDAYRSLFDAVKDTCGSLMRYWGIAILSSCVLCHSPSYSRGETDDVTRLFDDILDGDREARNAAIAELDRRNEDGELIAARAAAIANSRDVTAEARSVSLWLWHKKQNHTIASIGVCKKLMQRQSEPLTVRLAALQTMELIARAIGDQEESVRLISRLATNVSEAPEVRCHSMASLARLGGCCPTVRKAFQKLCRQREQVVEIRLALINSLKQLTRPECAEFCLLSLLKIAERTQSVATRLAAANAAIVAATTAGSESTKLGTIIRRWKRLGSDQSVDPRVRKSSLMVAEVLGELKKARNK